MDDLLTPLEPERVPLREGAVWLRGLALPAGGLLDALGPVLAAAPWRQMMTPWGKVMPVEMTNCGALGWVSDRRGYRYAAQDPLTGRPWPPLPAAWRALAIGAAAAAGFDGFEPDACLVNRYRPGVGLSAHQDLNEADHGHPIVSVSLGLPAQFYLLEGTSRTGPRQVLPLAHGDVVVWGGPARMAYHGVRPLRPGTHPVTGPWRLNLTLRRAGR